MKKIDMVADYYLSKSEMSPKKLQKILYYAYSWTLALLNERVDDLSFKLFDDQIEAWVHGPVVPYIYHKYKEYGWGNIPKLSNYNKNNFPEDVLDILEQVWTAYGDFSGNELESITHKEDPWIIARKGCSVSSPSSTPISDIIIFEYYNKRVTNG